MPCKTKASPEEMLDQIASYLYQGVTITQAAEKLHMSRITFRKWVLRYKEEGFKGLRPRQHLSYYSNQMKIQAVKEYLDRDMKQSGLTFPPGTLWFYMA